MNKALFLLLLIVGSVSFAQAQIYTSKSGEVSFFSEAPLENIEAHSKTVNAVLNIGSKDVLFIIPLTSFQFAKALMQEHFNEKYVESPKYPNAKFNGKLSDVDFTKDGVQHVTAKGILSLHGVEKEYTVKGDVTINGNQITIDAQFKIAMKDHNITIPSVVSQKVAESVLVKVKTVCMPHKK